MFTVLYSVISSGHVPTILHPTHTSTNHTRHTKKLRYTTVHYDLLPYTHVQLPQPSNTHPFPRSL